MPEKFWIDGKPDYQKLAQSYRESEQHQFRRREDIRKEIRDEIAAERNTQRPNSPGDYVIPEIKDAKGNKLEVNTKDPIFGFFTAEAHRMGLSQKEFDEVLDRYVHVELSRGPDWREESKALGENAELRRSRIATWARQNLDDETFGYFSDLPATAGMIKMWERVMEQTGNPAFTPTADGQSYNENLTREDLVKMQADDRYWKNGGDPQWIARVRAGWQALRRQKA